MEECCKGKEKCCKRWKRVGVEGGRGGCRRRRRLLMDCEGGKKERAMQGVGEEKWAIDGRGEEGIAWDRECTERTVGLGCGEQEGSWAKGKKEDCRNW